MTVEYIYGDSYEHIQNEKRADYHADQEKPHLIWAVSWDRNRVNLIRINTIPHDVDPAFCCHNVEKRNLRRQKVIEVLILVEPFSTVIHAVVFVQDVAFEFVWDVGAVAIEKRAFVEVGAQD